MRLTDNNIDKNSARYWCFLSDNKLKEALKEVIKDANSKTKKMLNEFVLPIVPIAIGAGKAFLWIAASLGMEWAIDKIGEDDPEAADYIKQNPRKAFELFTTNTKGLMDPDTLQNTANQIDDKTFLELCEDFNKIDMHLYGPKNASGAQLSEKEIREMMSKFENLNANILGLAYLLNAEVGTAEKWQKGDMDLNDKIDFSKFMLAPGDNAAEKFDPKNKLLSMKHDMAAGKKQLQFDNGKVSVVDIQQDEEPEKKSKEKSEEGKPEKDKQEQQAEQAAEKAVEDSPNIKSNSNAVAWIAGAAVAAVALPYLWKRLKQLADYVKSGHTLAMCKFRCSENDQEYQFEYDLKQMEWKLKFAGSTALKYTPYPSDDEVKSFVQTKFAKKFVDEVESQLKSLYSAKDKKILFKAVQAAGKEGSDLIKYLFDNQKAIESSLYGIKKHKIWESVRKYRKYRKWA